MIKDTLILMKWNVSNREYYQNLGYNFTKLNDEFYVHSIDLQPSSKKKVIVICDICGAEGKPTRRAIAQPICKRCKLSLHEETWKPEEIDLVKRTYSTTEDTQDLAKILGRTENAVKIKANKIGLKKNQRKRKYGDNPSNFDGTVSIIESKLFGNMIGDGWLTISSRYGKHNTTKGYYGGFSGDVNGLIQIQNDLRNIFGDGNLFGNITTRNTSSENYGIKGTTNSFAIYTVIAKHFLNMGMPYGNRVEKEFLLPEWLMKGTKLIKSAFISGLYSAEGTKFMMQVNDITLRAPSFVLTKRKSLQDNFKQLVAQLSSILNDLDIKFNVFYKETFTKSYNLRVEFVLSNEHENIFKLFKLLDLNYCAPKEKALQQVRVYYLAKAKCSNLRKIKQNIRYYDELLNNLDPILKSTIQELCFKFSQLSYFGLLPPGFPRFREFKSMCSNIKLFSNL